LNLVIASCEMRVGIQMDSRFGNCAPYEIFVGLRLLMGGVIRLLRTVR